VSTTQNSNASLIVDRNVEAGRAAKLAYIAADQTLTYDELRRQMNQMGRLLHELGARREERVLLVLDDTSTFPVAFLGTMRIGAVPVLVSLLDTPDHYRHYIEDSCARVVVCDSERVPLLREALADLDVRFVARGANEDHGVVELGSALRAQDDELAPVPMHADDAAFWLYSSGSTGRPKGIVHLQHDIEVTCQTFAREVLAIRESDRIFSTTKLYHAYGLGNGLSFPLHFGATAILMPGRPRPERILQTVREHQPTVYCSVPALYGQIAADPDADGAFDSVRLCVSAAEPLPHQTFDRWRERFGVEIVDGIGSTEMLHIYCSTRPGRTAAGTTGWPVPGYELRLVEEDGSVLEGAAVGALEVSGDSCAAFYWHHHDKTKRCMHGPWFHTGDRFERREDGSYVYVGRVDDMLKIGGLWVSPIDMEQILAEHPAVAGVGVIGVTVEHRSRIAAFVECADGAAASDPLADELRAWCKDRMRRYEYPHVVQFVQDLPRTATGKVQRFKLRELADRELAAT
jgi:benzoate-CoA ligase family protein